MRAVAQGLTPDTGGYSASVTSGNVLACGIFLATAPVGFSALAIPACRSRFAPGGVVVGLGGIGFAGFVLRWVRVRLRQQGAPSDWPDAAPSRF
jgi:hypothetical protein